ncbi:MAG: GNAT family N-acetyltransferase [Steroidobacteraceae bacterium]
MKTRLTVRDLSPALWPALEKLFGPRGACGGCWCMYWRLEKGERWDELKGAKAKLRFKKLVLAGKAHGALAFAGDEPVGWCAYDRRLDYPKLARARTLACVDADRVWSVSCFFIKPGWRDRGVATALLRHAVKSLKRRRAEIAEGYPVRLAKGQRFPNAFAWTGTRTLFESAGFTVAGTTEFSKLRMRRRP